MTESAPQNRSAEANPAALRFRQRNLARMLLLLAFALGAAGCTSLPEYIHNGFKVGPNYKTPPAPVGKDWIEGKDWPDADKEWQENYDKRVRRDTEDQSKWWTVFDDPVLDQLICTAYKQNLPLREAYWRIVQARAQLGIALGGLFPQSQTLTGDVLRRSVSTELVNTHFVSEPFTGQWDTTLSASWEIDFWGRLRRLVQSNRADFQSTMFDYDNVLVSLLGDVATNYVQMRITEQRIRYARKNAEIQRKTLAIAEAQFEGGAVGELDVDQAKTLLYQTEATVPELEIALRQYTNQLCILLGIPPVDLREKIGSGNIPIAPLDVAVGIPGDLLRRRPDVRKAERLAAAQSELIGVAAAEFYPHIYINGTIGYSAAQIKDLFRSSAMASSVGPSFQWNLFAYGRNLNNVRFQDAKFKELVVTYQQQVLTAQQEVENGLVMFVKGQKRTKLQSDSVTYAVKAEKVVRAQYEAGLIDLTRVTQLQQILVQEQDTLAQAQGEIGLGLILVYRALGGGWELRCNGCDPHAAAGDPAASLAAPNANAITDLPTPRPAAIGMPEMEAPKK